MTKYRVTHTLKALMRQHCITQEVLAEKLERHQDTVYRKMNGMSDWYLRECFVVAKLLGLNIEDVFLEN